MLPNVISYQCRPADLFCVSTAAQTSTAPWGPINFIILIKSKSKHKAQLFHRYNLLRLFQLYSASLYEFMALLKEPVSALDDATCLSGWDSVIKAASESVNNPWLSLWRLSVIQVMVVMDHKVLDDSYDINIIIMLIMSWGYQHQDYNRRSIRYRSIENPVCDDRESPADPPPISPKLVRYWMNELCSNRTGGCTVGS